MRSSAEESRLAKAAVDGDGEAFAELYDRYEGRIYNYCLRLLGNEHDAQDATQDAFLKIMRRLPEMGDRDLEFGAYLFRVARNTSYDMIGRRKKAEPVDEIGEDTGRLMGEGPALDEDPVRSAMLAAELDSIRAANARLPERQREVLALREIEGMSYEDIANLLEMNSNSVAQLISRARIRLRAELRGEAAAGVAASTPECEQALPLIARRQDGKLKDPAEVEWLTNHLATCSSCPVAAEAMAEAGVSYRAWAPVLPAAWLFRDTVAKAADLVGADWSSVTRPASPSASATGSAPAKGGQGSGGEAPSGGGEGQSGALAAAAAETEKKRRKRGLVAGGLGALVLLAVFGSLATGVLGGESDKRAAGGPEPETTAPDKSAPEPAGEPTQSSPSDAANEKPKQKQKKKKSKTVEPDPSPTPVATGPSTAPTQTAAPAASAPAADGSQPRSRRPRNRGQADLTGGNDSWGRPVRPEKPVEPTPPPTTTTPTPPSEPPTEPTPPTEPPTDPEPPTEPPPGGTDPGGGQPPTQPCSPVRGCTIP